MPASNGSEFCPEATCPTREGADGSPSEPQRTALAERLSSRMPMAATAMTKRA